jgi:hypothetical protein
MANTAYAIWGNDIHAIIDLLNTVQSLQCVLQKLFQIKRGHGNTGIRAVTERYAAKTRLIIVSATGGKVGTKPYQVRQMRDLANTYARPLAYNSPGH